MTSASNSAQGRDARSLKVCFVSAPLMARSGVYRSTHDLVAEARSRGLPWSARIGMRPDAKGTSHPQTGVTEFEVHSHGRNVIAELAEDFEASADLADADVIISMITQSDIALRRLRRRGKLADQSWIAFVRGLPWPDKGEQSEWRRIAMRELESRALRAADQVWATTVKLQEQISRAGAASIVQAGIPVKPRITDGSGSEGQLVWAGRLDKDKRPDFFIDLARETGLAARVYGAGPLLDALLAAAPANVEIAGWADPASLWHNAWAFVGTSRREAFGRSAAEAAQAGLPMLISDEYGVAPFLFTDPDLRRRCVLPVEDSAAWAASLRHLSTDQGLRRAVSDHVYANAAHLTIGASVDAILKRLSLTL